MNAIEMLETTNWTGCTLSQLCEAGRIGSRKVVKDWVLSVMNERIESDIASTRIEDVGVRSILAHIESVTDEICEKFNIGGVA